MIHVCGDSGRDPGACRADHAPSADTIRKADVALARSDAHLCPLCGLAPDEDGRCLSCERGE